MSETFDPYHVWLGIPPEEQPANHYRLLGLTEFESNPDVIEHAADRQMVHLRSLQTGKRGDLSQRLLNEVSTARLCLLSPERKSQYDAQLRESRATPQPASAFPQFAASAQVLPARPTRKKRRSGWSFRNFALGGVIVFGLAGLAVWLTGGKQSLPPWLTNLIALVAPQPAERPQAELAVDKKAKTPADDVPPSTEKPAPSDAGKLPPTPPPDSTVSHGDDAPVAAAEKSPASASKDGRLPNSKKSRAAASLKAGRPGPRTKRTSPSHDTSDGDALRLAPGASLPRDTWVDLLEHVQFKTPAGTPSWKRRADSFTLVDSRGVAALPVRVDGDYDLEIQFARESGGDAVDVLIPVGRQRCDVALSQWKGRESVLADVGEPLESPPKPIVTTATPGSLLNEQKYTLLVQVRLSGQNASIEVLLDKEPLLYWAGAQSSLASHLPPSQLPERLIPALTVQQPTTFHKIRLRLLQGTGSLLPRQAMRQ